MSVFGRLLNKSKTAAVPDALPKPPPGSLNRKQGNPETPFVVYGLGNKTHPNTKHSVRVGGRPSAWRCPDVPARVAWPAAWTDARRILGHLRREAAWNHRLAL